LIKYKACRRKELTQIVLTFSGRKGDEMVPTFREDENSHILRILYEYGAKLGRCRMAVDAVEKSDAHVYV
jgi:hypothetical protein